MRFPGYRKSIKANLPAKPCDLFVSWSGQYALDLALAIRQYFLDTKSKISLFVSAEDISLGAAWQGELKSQLDGAAQGLLLFTQDAAYSDWVLHEAAILSEKRNPIKIFLVDAPQALLPRPLRRFQVTHLSTETLRNLVRSFASVGQAVYSESHLQQLISRVSEIMERHRGRYVTDDERRWTRNMERPLSMAQQDSSPFDIEQLLSIARQRVVLIAQNHGFMTMAANNARESFWPIISNALIRGVTIDIVAMHEQAGLSGRPSEDVPSASRLWSRYMNAPFFEHHLKECWVTLHEWHKRYTAQYADGSHGQLRIFGAYFLPVTISVVDPEMSHAFLVLSPRMGHEANQHRPHFVLRQKHEPRVFAYYWGAVKNGFDNAGWRQMFREDLGTTA
jgi:hypothetical protein